MNITQLLHMLQLVCGGGGEVYISVITRGAGCLSLHNHDRSRYVRLWIQDDNPLEIRMYYYAGSVRPLEKYHIIGLPSVHLWRGLNIENLIGMANEVRQEMI